MPLHDWNHVEAGIFHAFHTAWIGEIQSSLNHGLLPSTFYALAEQHVGGYIADVLTLREPDPEERSSAESFSGTSSGGSATALASLPQTSIHESIEVDLTELRRSVAIRHVSTHRIIALIEIVSPANKDRIERLQSFLDKTLQALANGIHVLVVDVLAPGVHDPQGMHEAVRAAVSSVSNGTKATHRASTLASYLSQRTGFEAFVEHPQLGQLLPAMPVFLERIRYINVPLEETYQRAWDGMPAYWRNVIEKATPAT